jgi:hypothetical protein
VHENTFCIFFGHFSKHQNPPKTLPTFRAWVRDTWIEIIIGYTLASKEHHPNSQLLLSLRWDCVGLFVLGFASLQHTPKLSY